MKTPKAKRSHTEKQPRHSAREENHSLEKLLNSKLPGAEGEAGANTVLFAVLTQCKKKALAGHFDSMKMLYELYDDLQAELRRKTVNEPESAVIVVPGGAPHVYEWEVQPLADREMTGKAPKLAGQADHKMRPT